jgi:membrane protein YqaA with SNARE-associated domain
MGFLKSISQWLVATLEPYGAMGLMLIAIGDSSFLSLPEVNDAALMALSINHPYRMWELAAATVIGSVIGCTLLYTVGRKGGEAMLHKRFASEKVARVRGWYQKYGMLAVIVPSLLPPPLPFKIFVLSAGAFELPWARFMLAVAIGRSIRYFSEGILAVWYGKQAIEIVANNFPIVGMVLAGLIVAAAVVYALVRRRRAATGVVLLPLLFTLLGSGCFLPKTKTLPEVERMLPSYPITREQAIQRLEMISRSIQSLKAPIELTGSSITGDLKTTSPTLSGAILIQQPNRILLKGSVTPLTIFEMVSDGTRFQFFSVQKNELYVDGREDGPPYKRFDHLGEMANKFVNLRPRQIEQALLIDVLPLLSDPKIRIAAVENPVKQDRRKYFCVDFLEDSSTRDARLIQRIWFDLSTQNVDVARRQTWNTNDELEVDARYADYQSLPAGIRYPSKVEIEFSKENTVITIKLDPKEAVFNGDLPATTFDLNPHPDAKIYRFEPVNGNPVTQQR